MGFFYSDPTPGAKPKAVSKARGKTIPIKVSGCAHCSLNNEPLRSPKMQPTGSARPLVYILGEAPGAEEDKAAEQFVGDSGRILRSALPEDYESITRWNNTIRCRPPQNREPSPLETQCCRKSIEEDIEATKPKLILLMGAVPLRWATGLTKIQALRGRLMPVRIGKHECYALASLHPDYILRNRRTRNGPAWTRVFEKDLIRAYELAESLDTEPFIPKPEEYYEGVECLETADLTRLKVMLDEALTWDEVTIDIETNGERPYFKDARILSFSISCFEKTFAFPYKHSQTPWSKKDLKSVFKLIYDFLIASKRKWAHNLNFELEWLYVEFGWSVVWETQWGDTMAQAYVLDEREGAKSLDSLCVEYMGFQLKSISNIDRKNLDKAPLPDVLRYNALDAKYTWPLISFQQQRLEAEGLVSVYEMTVSRSLVIAPAQALGVIPNFEAVEELNSKLEGEITEVLKKILSDRDVRAFMKAKPNFSPTNNNDVLAFFKDHLRRREVNVGKKDKPKYSCDESVLSRIDHPVSVLILELRGKAKVLSTYIAPYRKGTGKHIHADQLIHTLFNHLLTETGRWSSEDPNLQNFPNRKGKEVRAIIKAPENGWIVSIDYGQIEARVIGMASHDKVLCDSLWTGYDIHGEWAERLAHAYPQRIGGKKFLKDKDVLKAFRKDVKNQWTFPLFFGSMMESVAGNLQMPEEVVSPLYDEFWGMFGGVKAWQDKMLKRYKQVGYVETLTGRRRHEPINDNQIINSPIQGTASEIVTDGSVRLSRLAYFEQRPELQFRINVHDDLTFYFSDEQLEDNIQTVAREMLACPFEFINVPLTVEVSVGKTWDSQEEVEVFSSIDFGLIKRAVAR